MPTCVSTQPTFRTPSYVFENFLLDTPTMGNLPAKHSNRSPQILDLARIGEQPGDRNYPSIRHSLSKERFSKHALIAKICPKAAKTGCKQLRIIPIVLICRCGMWGYDSHKNVKRRKRHLLVDCLGLPLSVYVTPTDVQERAGARCLLAGLKLSASHCSEFVLNPSRTISIEVGLTFRSPLNGYSIDLIVTSMLVTINVSVATNTMCIRKFFIPKR